MPPPAAALPLPGLLSRLTRDPGRPRLTWYGPGGERIELSGHVLDNWVTKTTNLLLEEYEAGPGTRVLVDLPVHWRTVVWAFAVWRAGACVVLPDGGALPDGGDAGSGSVGSPALLEVPDVATIDVVVTSRPDAYADAAGAEVVAVALPALARSFDGPLTGAVDAAAAVMTYGDVLTWVPEGDAGAPALDDSVRHRDLLDWAVQHRAPVAADRPRVLVEATDHSRVADVLAHVLATLGADGSVVLCAPSMTAELAADLTRRARLLSTERITA